MNVVNNSSRGSLPREVRPETSGLNALPPNDRQHTVVMDDLQADMDMVVVQEIIVRRNA